MYCGSLGLLYNRFDWLLMNFNIHNSQDNLDFKERQTIDETKHKYNTYITSSKYKCDKIEEELGELGGLWDDCQDRSWRLSI